MANTEEEIISGAEFARRLGVDRSAVTRYVNAGKLEPFSKEWQGLKYTPRFRASDVERFKRPSTVNSSVLE